MAWRFWAKIEGCDVDTFSTGHASYTAIELPILGIFPAFVIESNNVTTIGGTEIGQRKMRHKLELNMFPVSTWDNGNTISTDHIMYLLDTVLQKKYTRLVAPTAPKVLPDRWRDTTNFPNTATLIPFVFARCEVTNEKLWASGNERLTLTLYSRDLN